MGECGLSLKEKFFPPRSPPPIIHQIDWKHCKDARDAGQPGAKLPQTLHSGRDKQHPAPYNVIRHLHYPPTCELTCMTLGMHLTSSSEESGVSRKEGSPLVSTACRGRPWWCSCSRFMKGGSGSENSASCGRGRRVRRVSLTLWKIKWGNWMFLWWFFGQSCMGNSICTMSTTVP